VIIVNALDIGHLNAESLMATNVATVGKSVTKPRTIGERRKPKRKIRRKLQKKLQKTPTW